ncbi:MAG: DNRLRE domain-containing protein, partial [Myxococcota bacterium]
MVGSFYFVPHADFHAGTITVRTEFSASLGEVDLEDVRWISATELVATVPTSLPVGTYDLRVEDPAGRIGRRTDAFTVIPRALACNVNTFDPTGSNVTDATIDEENPSTNFRFDPLLTIGSTASTRKRAVIRFDLSSIPLGWAISSATLTMHSPSGGGSARTGMHRIVSPWAESMVTWDFPWAAAG